MDLREAINGRHSTRSFKSSKAKLKDVFEVLESALHSPMAGNVYNLKLILIEDGDLKKQLAEVSIDNEFIGDSSHLIVVCSDLKQAQTMFDEKGPVYSAQQSGAAIENMLLTAESLGLASCWTSGFDENFVKRVLKVPEDYRVEAIIALGYEMKKPEKKKRPGFKEAVFYNKFGKKEQ